MKTKDTLENGRSTMSQGHKVGGPSTSHRYPLELVANVAARFSGDGNFEAAAKRALALLDACTAVLEAGDEPVQAKAPTTPQRPPDMYWDDLVKYLIGGERRSRAESKMNDFLKFDVRRGKAVELAKTWVGTTQTAERAWAQFFEKVPETTSAELSERLRELSKPSVGLLSGKKLPNISGGLAEIYRGRYAEWEQYAKAKKASESGKRGGRGHKKEAGT